MKFLFLVISILLAGQSIAQTGCEASSNKKVLKLLDQGKNKKYALQDRIRFLQDAIELDENCFECHFILGERFFKRAQNSDRLGYNTAKEQFKFIAEHCPGYHADVFYYLGTISYLDQDWSESKINFQRFKDFNLDNTAGVPNDYDQKYNDINEVLDEIAFNESFYGNPVPFNPIKVEGVSTGKDEYLPALSPDNEIIFYTRKYEKKAMGDLFGRLVEELTTSKRPEMMGKFDAGEALKVPFNLGDNYGGVTLSVNNKEMFVTVCKPGKMGYNNCDIYSSRWEKTFDKELLTENYRWSDLENMGSNVNTDDGWEAQPSLASDGSTLYFATARATSTETETGGKSIDIFYCIRDQNGNWGLAKKLGSSVNTGANEKSPFMHGDSRTLYFSSDRPSGAGGYDIYFTRLKDDGSWTKPLNIGVPINTPEDEHGLIVSTDGSLAYFASNRIKGAAGYDIFSFEMPEIAKPEKVVLIKGEVKNDEGEKITDAVVELKYAESKKVEQVKVDEEDGKFAAIINVERENVVMKISKKEHAFEARVFTKELAETHPVNRIESLLESIETGKSYTIDDINYKTGSAEINPESKLILDEFVEFLNSEKQLVIEIHGHTDNVGSRESNMALSSERAFEVMSYLEEKGVDEKRMTFNGFGPDKPLGNNETEAGRAKNRRTEFLIISQ